MKIVCAGNTHQGLVRQNNEDSWLVADIAPGLILLLVADGVGGHASGEVASRLVSDSFAGLVSDGKLSAASDLKLRTAMLDMAVQQAHVAVVEAAGADPRQADMASTLTVAILDDETFTVAQVGDSRLYHWSATGGLKQVTLDQTMASLRAELGQIAVSEIESHPDRNVLSQAIGFEGVDGPLRAVVDVGGWGAGDKLMLCSDGLSNMLSDEAIADIVARVDIRAAPEALIDAAIEAGGKDNVTVVMAERME